LQQDKIVGKTATFFYVKLGAKEVYAHLMSDVGICTLARHGIYPVWEKFVPNILNQDRTDTCPMKKLVATVHNVD